MPDCAPDNDKLVTSTVLFVPYPAVRNAPAALPVTRLTVSPLMTPEMLAPATVRVAVMVPSYGLSLAVMPETVSGFFVIVAVGVGGVSE